MYFHPNKTQECEDNSTKHVQWQNFDEVQHNLIGVSVHFHIDAY